MVPLSIRPREIPVIQLPGTVFEDESVLKDPDFEDIHARTARHSIALINTNRIYSALSSHDTTGHNNFSQIPSNETTPRITFINPTPPKSPHSGDDTTGQNNASPIPSNENTPRIGFLNPAPPKSPHSNIFTSINFPSSFSLRMNSLLPPSRTSTCSPRLEFDAVKGEVRLEDGTIEEGYFVNGKLHGKGFRKQKDKIEYLEGFLELTKGTIEKGEFEEGHLTFGEKFSTQAFEEGHFDQNGKLDGAGHRIFPDGTEEEGVFRSGEFTRGVKTWADGRCEKGQFVDGLLNGNDRKPGFKCKRFYPNREVEIGTFVRGILRCEGVKLNADHEFVAGKHNSKTELEEVVIFENFEAAEAYFTFQKQVSENIKLGIASTPIPLAFGSIRTKVYTRQASGEVLLSSSSDLLTTLMSPGVANIPYMKMFLNLKQSDTQ